MAGIKKIAIANVTHSKTKGKAFVEELNKALSPEALLKIKGNETVAKKKHA